MEAQREAESKEVRRCKDKVDELRGQLAGMDFSYRDPEPHFDRSKVKGVVAKLVRVKDTVAATALEVAAGGRLYQVVVDTDATAKKIVSKGALAKRVTIIPLNQASTSSGRKSSSRRSPRLQGLLSWWGAWLVLFRGQHAPKSIH